MTCYRAGYTGSAWTVERSPDGIHAEVIATLPTAKSARALISSLEGTLTPSREGTDDSPRPSLPPAARRAPLGHATPLGLGGFPSES